MMKSGTSGTLIYEDVAVGDLISSFSGYGIANDSTSGSESFNISANVPSVSISEAKDYYINVTLSPADRTPAPNTKVHLAVGCYLPSGYTCTISSNTPCGLKAADGMKVGNNLWDGGMSYGGGNLDIGQNVTIQIDSEIRCETGQYYTFVVDYIEIGGKKVDSNTRSFYLKANGDPGNVWVRYRLK
ncbi:unknown [Proteobacteria bacterium CAG:495]|nr:unknown [Proteobacteria bacterium CAG:495]